MRIILAFFPTHNFQSAAAKAAGARDLLASYYYLSEKYLEGDGLECLVKTGLQSCQLCDVDEILDGSVSGLREGGHVSLRQKGMVLRIARYEKMVD